MSQNFALFDLKQKKKGEIIEIKLDHAANVRLMDYSNLSRYKSGKQHKYYGGLVKKSPFYITIPSNGHWYITVDTWGLKHSAKVSVDIIPAPLPEAKQNVIKDVPLVALPSLIRHNISSEQEIYDVFISHASEDKDSIVRELAIALQDEGLKVWYDEFSLRIGDSLRRSIDRGVANSRIGLVVISPAFMRKGWTNYELDGIITRSVSGEQILLPIWHNVTLEDVVHFSPSLADKVARDTARMSVSDIAHEIYELLHSH